MAIELQLRVVRYYLTLTTAWADVSGSQFKSPEYDTVITFVPGDRTTGNVKIGVPPFPIVRNSAGPRGCAAPPLTESKNCTVPDGVAFGFSEMMRLLGAPITFTVRLVCVPAVTTAEAGFNATVGFPRFTSVVKTALLNGL
jgi:hypothetical protein